MKYNFHFLFSIVLSFFFNTFTMETHYIRSDQEVLTQIQNIKQAMLRTRKKNIELNLKLLDENKSPALYHLIKRAYLNTPIPTKHYSKLRDLGLNPESKMVLRILKTKYGYEHIYVLTFPE